MPTNKSITTKKEKMDETLTLIEQSIQKKSSLTERIQKMIKKCDDAIIYKGDKIKSEHFSPTNS